jgi:hypothetical protein
MVLTTAEVAIAAPAIAVAGTLLGAWIQSRRDERRNQAEREQERLRWGREDVLNHDKWQRELLAKWADDRRVAYATFLASTSEWSDEIESFVMRISSPVDLSSSDALSELTENPNYEGPRNHSRLALANLELLAGNKTREKAQRLVSQLSSTSAGARVAHYAIISTASLGEIDRTLDLRRELADQIGRRVRGLDQLRGEFLELAQAEIGTSEEQ